MNRLPALASLVLLASGTSGPTDPPAGIAAGRPVPMVVTTDTETYCQSLWSGIGTQAPLPATVAVLHDEGHALCLHGQIRAGISRLRRALMVLRAGHGSGADGSPGGS